MTNKIFVLHGWAYDTSKWDLFVQEMKNNNVMVELLDIPGLTEETQRVWSLEDYVEWLNKKLANEKETILIGHSNGGRIAIDYAASYSDKLSKLILIDSAGIYHNEFPIRFKRIFFKSLAKIGKKFTKSSLLKKLLYKLAREKDYYQASETMKKTMQNLIEVDLRDRLNKVNIPTLVIWGENDKITPLSDAYLMKEDIKDSELSIIKNAKHSPQFTNTKEVVGKILEFIKK